ncbi:MAG: tetratricopeptide repeat protein [Verrucomicrobia bacterium]|nr:tetratricopeptide repeat protein [Verrucomicrobiota bacterium]
MIFRAALVSAVVSSVVALAEKTEPPNFMPGVVVNALAEGNAAFEKQDLPVARRAYEQVLKVDPRNVAALVNLGLIEIQLKNPKRAEELLNQAVDIRIDTPQAWLALGMIHMDAEKPDAALAALSQAVLRDPENPKARNFLGVVIGRRGWIDGAQAELRRAVELDPAYADAHYNLAVFYLQEKPPAVELARRHYFKARELGVEKDPEMEKVFRQPPTTP